MCEMCLDKTCLCNSCEAWPHKPCPRCHHLRAFYVIKTRADWKRGVIRVRIK